MYLSPIWCSLISLVISARIGKHLGSRGVSISSILGISICTVSSMYIFYEICICNSTCKIELFDWIVIDFIELKWCFYYDPLSPVMLMVINIVSLRAQIYSIEYMREDPHNIRFFSYLSLSTFFMIFPVLSDNMLQLFMGWEGVGICPYLSINFWATRVQANKASILAVITNKVGDIASLICRALVYHEWKTLNFSILFSCVDSMSSVFVDDIDNTYVIPSVGSANLSDTSSHISMIDATSTHISLVCFFPVPAAIGKSAQAGLHIWLPEAMEGPTPVSSLIHAATMVTAGIFLSVRRSHFLSATSSFFVFIIFFGSVTASLSSTIGLLQNDPKKVVAYSTCSQLGYMFTCRGLSAYNNGMYHLFNHAFFKALLFLTAGYIIHAMSNEQDIRKMGGLARVPPLPYIMMLVGSLSLMGFPFLSGFYSKDKIIESCFNSYMHLFDVLTIYKYVLLSQTLRLLAVICTTIYSIKLLFYVSLNSYNGFRQYVSDIHFSSSCIRLPLCMLSLLSITSGYLTSDMMVGVGSNLRQKSIYMDSFVLGGADGVGFAKSFFSLHTEYNDYIRQVTLAWTVYFTIISIYAFSYFKHFIYYSIVGSLPWLGSIYTFVGRKYIFINRLVVTKLVQFSFSFSYAAAYKLFDKGLIEFVGPFGIVAATKEIIFSQSRIQSGLIYHYSGFILLMLVLVSHFFYDHLYSSI